MKTISLAGALACLVAFSLAGSALAAGPSKVHLRVEGQSKTVLPRTALTTSVRTVQKDPQGSCTGTSAIGALDTGTDGRWDGDYSFSQTVETILGETHRFEQGARQNRYWTFWLNYQYQNQGPCDVELQEGDDVLFFVDCFGECATVTPLRLEVPATARPGGTVEAKVTEYDVQFDQNFNGTTSARPSAGASVEVGDRAYTTDANGIARFPAVGRGPNTVRAVKPDHVRSATETVCATDGADGFCGTTKPGETPQASQPCATTGDDGLCGTRDRRAPQARWTNLTEQQRYRRGRGPRELRGLVAPDPSGLHAVKLRLTRRHAGRCSYYSPRTETLRRTRCGRSFAFGIGDRAEFSYLLPKRLPRGRYVLDVVAIDKAFNRDPLARGRNRVVFFVS